MSATVIDCFGPDVIKIDIADDHAHMTVLTSSWSNENGHMPAESASVAFSPEAAQTLIDALTPLAKMKKPTLRSVEKREH